MINQSKHIRQVAGGEKWKAANGKGALVYPMGFGKTRTALLLCDKLNKANSDADFIIIIVVPSDAARQVWMKAVLDWDENLPIYIYTANSIVIIKEVFEASLLIIDEIHRFTTDERIKIYNGSFITYKYILGLTGTYPLGAAGRHMAKFMPIVDQMSAEEAIEQGWITPFIEYNIGIDLPYDDKVRYEKLSIPIGETLNLFKGVSKKFGHVDGKPLFWSDYDLIVSCTSGKKIKGGFIHPDLVRDSVAKTMGWRKDIQLLTQYEIERDNWWNPSGIKERCTNFMKLVYNRNTIITNSMAKLEVVIEIYKKFPNPTICFNESTSFADLIAARINALIDMFDIEALPAICYHTNMESRALVGSDGSFITYKTGARAGEPKMFGKDSLKKNAIGGMRNGTFGFISTARALNESLDLPQLSQVITTGGSTDPLTYKQRNARGQRIDIYNPNKITRIFNIYFEDFESVTGAKDRAGNLKTIVSRDKTKLMNRQSLNNYTIKTVKLVDDIV